MARSRSLLLRLAALGTGVLAALGIGEAGARAVESQRSKRVAHAPLSLPLLVPNPRGTGSYRLKPDVSTTAEVEGRMIAIRTNRFGMRWREVERKKASGARRLAVFGDSFAFGCWSDSIEESFVGVIDKQLSSEGVETLNFGVGGYGVVDEDLLLREEALDFQPDSVLLVLFNANDFRDTYLGLDKESLANGTAVLNREALKTRVPPRFLVSDQPPMPLLPPQRAWERSLRHVALFRIAAPLFDLDSPWIVFRPSREFISYAFWSRDPYPDVAVEAVKATLAAIDRIETRLRGLGIRMYVAAIPTAEQVYAAEMKGPGYDLSSPQRFVEAHAATAGIPFLDLLPPLRAYARTSGHRPYLRRDTHLNNLGHGFVGKAIAEWLLKEGIVNSHASVAPSP